MTFPKFESMLNFKMLIAMLDVKLKFCLIFNLTCYQLSWVSAITRNHKGDCHCFAIKEIFNKNRQPLNVSQSVCCLPSWMTEITAILDTIWCKNIPYMTY